MVIMIKKKKKREMEHARSGTGGGNFLKRHGGHGSCNNIAKTDDVLN